MDPKERAEKYKARILDIHDAFSRVTSQHGSEPNDRDLRLVFQCRLEERLEAIFRELRLLRQGRVKGK